MRLKHAIRHLIQRVGIDVVRYPLHDPLARTVQLLHFHRVGCVVDVGANDGGFATAIRRLGFAGRIISFEPLEGPFDALRRKAEADEKWEVVRSAIGNSNSDVAINVSGNAGLSSSVLPMLDRHISAAPKSHDVGTQTVPQDRLDVLLPRMGVGEQDRVFLKIDVQGYERAVFEGAEAVLGGDAIIGLQLEMSLVPLYDGAMGYREALERAEKLGMTLVGLDPVLADPTSGQLLQADAVFFRQADK